jgi:predicted CXXCH cytochrome family protein
MITLPRFNKSTLLIGGVSLWGLLLVSCVVANRTMVAPPQVAGATFIGSKACTECHDKITSNFHDATHAKLMAPGDNAKNIGCESCHGPGSVHSKSGGALGTIVNPGRSPETCFQCHVNLRGQFQQASTHPVLAGQMSCSDCHEPHQGSARPESGTQLAVLNETCTKCHAQQGGPFVFEHEGLRDGCVTCHDPHGTANAKMLRVRNQNLCLQCHFQQQTTAGQLLIGGRDHASFISRGTCWSAGCHEAVHGSHVNRSLRF